MIAKAYSPAGLSGMFSTHIVEGDLLRTGASGGGITLKEGVLVSVRIEEAESSKINTLLNGKECDCYVARKVAEKLLKKAEGEYEITIDQSIKVPIGGGLGTSGASAIATSLALGKALNLKMTYEELARVAHVVEIESCTGLGTVSGLAVGGVVLVTKAGAPGFDEVERLVVDPSLKVVLGFYKPIEKRKVLENKNLDAINKYGLQALQSVKENPCIEEFMESCFWFARTTGLLSHKVLKGIEASLDAGALAASQAMIGETVFSIVDNEKVEDVASSLRNTGALVVISEIEACPARLL
ncbi:MAG: hypothetical protein DRJ64_00310 [Thermoprotei archaeon]|nr:MAG: hypothetical protein DRJ64_00310 [Thermoprotei archaeon]